MVGAFNQYKGLSREVYILLFARVINAFGYFVFPFMTLFMKSKMGLESDVIGRFLFFAALVHVPGSMIGGKIADTIGRKKTILIFSGFGAITYIVCGFIGTSISIGYLLIASSFFMSISDPAMSAMIMDLTKPEDRQSVMSLIYLGLNVGIATGALVAGFLFNNYSKWLFWGDGITTILSLILIITFIKETLPSKAEIANIEKTSRRDEFSEDGKFYKVILSRPFLLVFALISTIFSFVYAQTGFLIPTHLSELFGENASGMYGSLMSLNGVIVVICTPFLIMITKKIKPAVNVAIAGVIYAIGFGMLTFAKDYRFFIISIVIWTFGEIIGGVNTGVYIANHSPVSHRGRFQSIFTITRESGRALGPLLIGMHLMKDSISSAWIVIAQAAIIGSLGMLILYKIEKEYKVRKNNRKENKIKKIV